MYWGWKPSLLNTAQGIQLISYNGWFNENNFNPNSGEKDYNYQKKLTYNIVP